MTPLSALLSLDNNKIHEKLKLFFPVSSYCPSQATFPWSSSSQTETSSDGNLLSASQPGNIWKGFNHAVLLQTESGGPLGPSPNASVPEESRPRVVDSYILQRCLVPDKTSSLNPKNMYRGQAVGPSCRWKRAAFPYKLPSQKVAQASPV